MKARLHQLFLAAMASLGGAGCSAVVGAECAEGLQQCGAICCSSGLVCSDEMICVPAPPAARADAGDLPPWARRDGGIDAGSTPVTPWDGGPYTPIDGGHLDAGADASADAGPGDAAPDAGPHDAGDGGVDYDSGPKDAEPEAGVPDAGADAGFPDAAADAGFPDATADAGAPDAAADAGFPDAAADAGFPDAAADAGFPDSGADAGTPDAGTPDAGAPDAGFVDAGFPDSGADAGFPDSGADAGFPDSGPICPIGTTSCGPAGCVDTDSDSAHCGACNNACAPTEFCSAGACTPNCPAPRTQCPNACVDVMLDPNNCGTCGTTCGSGVCFQGGCVAASAGHVVVIGHDMRTIHPASYRISGNAIFLPVSDPLDVGVFMARTSAGAVAGLDWTIRNAAQDMGRTFTSTVVDAMDVTQRLATLDVFVIFPQEFSDDAELTQWGVDWSLALNAFVRRGGTVVLFDAGGAHAGAWQILDAAGLFPASARASLPPGSMLDVVAPADALARGAPLSYPAQMNTVTFTSTATDVVVGTQALPVLPVVFHRVILP